MKVFLFDFFLIEFLLLISDVCDFPIIVDEI